MSEPAYLGLPLRYPAGPWGLHGGACSPHMVLFQTVGAAQRHGYTLDSWVYGRMERWYAQLDCLGAPYAARDAAGDWLSRLTDPREVGQLRQLADQAVAYLNRLAAPGLQFRLTLGDGLYLVDAAAGPGEATAEAWPPERVADVNRAIRESEAATRRAAVA